MTTTRVIVLFTALSVIGSGCGGQGMDGGDNGAGGSSMMTNTSTGGTMPPPDTGNGGSNTPGTGGMDTTGNGGSNTPGTGGTMDTTGNGGSNTPGTGGAPGNVGTGGSNTPGTGGAMMGTGGSTLQGPLGSLDSSIKACPAVMPAACVGLDPLVSGPNCCGMYNATKACGNMTMPNPMLVPKQLTKYATALGANVSAAHIKVSMVNGVFSAVKTSDMTTPAMDVFCAMPDGPLANAIAVGVASQPLP